MSGFVHAGSSQIVAVEQFASGEFVTGAVLAGAALNLRYLGIIASLAEVLKDIPFRLRLVAIHITGDENWALTMAQRVKDPEVGAWFLIGSGVTMISVWVVSTTTGAVIGTVIPDLEKYGLGFAFTAAFIAMARAMFVGRRNVVPWVVTFGVTILLTKAGVIGAYAILVGSLIGVAISTGMRSRSEGMQ